MKFHWGHGITLTFIVFVVFILAMIFKSTENNIHLVSEDYYNDELRFQEKIDKIQNTKLLAAKPTFVLSGRELVLTFPQDLLGGGPLKGTVTLFRPSDSRFDKDFELRLSDEGVQKIDLQKTLSGFYKVQLEWTDHAKTYYTEKEITLN